MAHDVYSFLNKLPKYKPRYTFTHTTRLNLINTNHVSVSL